MRSGNSLLCCVYLCIILYNYVFVKCFFCFFLKKSFLQPFSRCIKKNYIFYGTCFGSFAIGRTLRRHLHDIMAKHIIPDCKERISLKKHLTRCQVLFLAEREGFEPSRGVTAYRCSKPNPSASWVSLHILFIFYV